MKWGFSMDYGESIMDFDGNLEEFERKLFNKYREDLKDYLINNDSNALDNINDLTDGNLLSSLILIRSFESQEQINKLTKVLIFFTFVLVAFTVVLAFLTYLLYLKG